VSQHTRPATGGLALRLPARSASVATARHAVRDLAEQWALPEAVVLDAEMVVSELVTNAVLHARTDCELSIEPRLPGLRLAVADDDADAPILAAAFVPLADGLLSGAVEGDQALVDLLAERATGRGMAIVDALSTTWGVEARNPGKVVWAELGTHPKRVGAQPTTLTSMHRRDTRALRLIAVPVRLLVQSDNAVAALVREFQLAIVDHPDGRRIGEAHITGQVLARIEGATRPREHAVHAALARGDHLVDLDLELPTMAPGTLAEVDELMARMALAGRSGAALRPPEVIAFDTWYRNEISAQMSGALPRACPFPGAGSHAHHAEPELTPRWRRAIRALERHVAGITDERGVEQALTEFAVKSLRAHDGGVCRLDADGTTVRITASTGFTDEVTSAWGEFALSADLPASEAIRTNQPVVIRTIGERDERYKAFITRPALSDPTSACIPIAPPLGVPFGCLVLGFAAARDFSPDELAFLRALASVGGGRVKVLRDEQGAAHRRGRQVALERVVKAFALAATEENMAAVACNALVPDVADMAAVGLRGQDEPVTFVAVHREGEKLSLLERLHGQWGSRRVDDAWRRGRPFVFHVAPDDALTRVAEDDEHLGALRELGLTAGAILPVTDGGPVVGTLALCTAGGRALSDDDVAFATEVARWLAGALAKRRGAAGAGAPTGGTDAGRELLPPPDAVVALALSLSGAATLDEICGALFRQVVGALRAASSSVWVRGADGALRLTSGVGVPPLTASIVSAIGPDSDLPAAEAVRTGEAVWYGSTDERDRRWPELAGAPSPSEANVVLPLRARGATRGVLSIGFAEARSFAPAELAGLQQVADLCATALDRAELFDAEREARQLVQFLSDAGAVLAGSLEPERIVALVADLAVPRLGDWCSVHLPDGPWLRRAAVNIAGDAPLASRLVGTALRADDGSPVSRCFHEGTIVVSPELTNRGLAAAHPGDVLPGVLALGLVDAVTAPVLNRGRVLGVLTVASRAGHRSRSELFVQAVSELAARVGAALETAQRFSTEQAVSRELAAALLPTTTPHLRGFALEARYLPATGDVCGDWYEAHRLPDGRLLVGIGDAAGHGVAAAALMAELRYGARALAAVARSPGELLHELGTAMALGERYATALYFVIDPVTLVATWASAGHLPALLVPNGGRPRFLREHSGPPLGCPPTAWPDRVLTLAPGDTVVLYTDGVVERRGAALDKGMRQLAAVGARRRQVSAAALADLLVDLGGADEDDACVVVLRVDGGTSA
jgi:GAF domain-containing protein